MFDLTKLPIDLVDIVNKTSTRFNIPNNFLFALIKTESNFVQTQIRFEPFYKDFYQVDQLAKKLQLSKLTMQNVQACSYGYTQVLGAVFYELGFTGYPVELYASKLNIEYACKHIARLRDRFKINISSSPLDMYAAYNHGSVQKLKTDPSKYVNEENVNRFHDNYNLF